MAAIAHDAVYMFAERAPLHVSMVVFNAMQKKMPFWCPRCRDSKGHCLSITLRGPCSFQCHCGCKVIADLTVVGSGDDPIIMEM